MKIWILTEEQNQYDQYGEYFVEVFKSKPSLDQIKSACKGRGELISDYYAVHISNGGGRVDIENTWFYLKEKEL